MEARTEDFYFAIVSGEIEELYTAASAEAPEGVNVEDVDRKGPYWNIEAAEPTFIPVPVLTDPDHKKYLDPLGLDALLGSTVSDRAREWEYKKAVSIWQHYRDNSGSRRLDRVLKRVYICLSDLAEKYGFSASLPTLTTGGSAQDPAGQTAAAAQEPAGKTAADPQSHGVPEGLPAKLRKDAAYRLFEALEAAGFIGRDWKPTARFIWDTPTKKGQPRIWDIVYMAALFKQIGINDYADAFQTFWGLTNVAANKSAKRNYGTKSANQKALDELYDKFTKEQ